MKGGKGGMGGDAGGRTCERRALRRGDADARITRLERRNLTMGISSGRGIGGRGGPEPAPLGGASEGARGFSDSVIVRGRLPNSSC